MLIISGTCRCGPANCTGDARSEKCGSVMMFTPPVCSSTVACPIQVIVRSVRLVFRNATSGFTLGNTLAQPPGGGGTVPSRSRSHCHFQKLWLAICG